MRSAPGHWFISWLISLYVRFVYLTTKWQFIGFEERNKFAAKHKGAIVLQWHNRIAMVGFGWDSRKYPIHLLTSAHPDGRIVASALSHIGMDGIYGSSSKGGAKALLACIKHVQSGGFLGMTPDGPRGPRMRLKDGPVAIAKKTNAPVCLITYSVKKRKTLKTWDRFVFPKPFNEGVILWRELKSAPEDADKAALEEYRKYLEDSLTEATNEVDKMMGHEIIPPSDLPHNHVIQSKKDSDKAR
ncbi:MAG: lysophospholipid acyltransferase family protein [Alphaproteobacteria bacterium]|nr:lysophospholipid acyltransferase family protein [Alphaproteobacteria bacterium]